MVVPTPNFVIPTKVGNQNTANDVQLLAVCRFLWVPSFDGMTECFQQVQSKLITL